MNNDPLAYNPITNQILEELTKIFGPKDIIYNDEEKLEPYSHDEVSDTKYARMPQVVVKPQNPEQISAMMKLANKNNIPVTPRGAGTGLSGGAVPVYGGIVVSLENMNHIIEIDKHNMVAVVEPGIITNELNNILIQETGLWFAGYPMSAQSCFIGGNVAENAGGGRAVKYGVTSRYVLGLEVVLPTGEIITFGGKRVKDVTGYNLIPLMVGSEGTLGIFTKIYFKLLPYPAHSVVLLALFKDIRAAINMVPKIMTYGKIIPTSIEFMDKLSVKTSCGYLNENIPYEESQAMLLIEIDGNTSEQLEQDYETIGDLCEQGGAMEVYIADNATTKKRVWSIRQNIAEAFMAVSPDQSLEDVVVPISAIPEMMDKILALSAKYDTPIPTYGHAGDGNLHCTPVRNPEHSKEHWDEILPELLKELYTGVRELGGTLSGEHGIGHKRKKYMDLVLSQKELELMRGIKDVFDPNNILNPGKML